MQEKPKKDLKEPVAAVSVPVSMRQTIYPQPFAKQVAGRLKRKLGDYFALSNFGVNLTTLQQGAVSALLHHHSRQDEFIYVLEGRPTLVLGRQQFQLKAGDCYGFKAGSGIGAQLVNHAAEPAVFLEIGDRTQGDEVTYPDDDLKAIQLADGKWQLSHKDGRPY